MMSRSSSIAEREEKRQDHETTEATERDRFIYAIGPLSSRPEQIAVLQKVIGLKLREIAFAAGVSRETARLWRRTDNGDRPDGYEDLRAVAERLLRGRSLNPILIGAWFRSRNRGLGYRRPLEAIRAGAFEEVIEVAESFIALSAAAPGHARSGEEAAVLEKHDVVKAVTQS